MNVFHVGIDPESGALRLDQSYPLASMQDYYLADRCVGSIFDRCLEPGEFVKFKEGCFKLDENLDLIPQRIFYVSEATGCVSESRPNGVYFSVESEEEGIELIEKLGLPYRKVQVRFEIPGWTNIQQDTAVVNQRGEIVEMPPYAQVNGYRNLEVL